MLNNNDRDISEVMKIIKYLKYEWWTKCKLESILDLDDFEQECYVYYFKYYHGKWNDEKGFAFTTHVRQAVKGCATKLARKNFHTKERLQPWQLDYNNVIQGGEGEIDRFDLMPSFTNIGEEVAENDIIKQAINSLSELDKKAIELYIQGYNYLEIGGILKNNPTNSSVAWRAIKRFKKAYLNLIEKTNKEG